MSNPETLGAALESDAEWAMIEAQLPPDFRELAEQDQSINLHPLALPPQFGAKVTDISQILRLAFYHVATNSSLRTTTAMAVAAGIITLSAVALHKWMQKLGSYMATLLGHMTDTKLVFAAERWAGYDIRIEDATSITRPGACSTTGRVHYSLQLTTLRPMQIVVTDETGGETFRRFDAQRGQLHIGDRVYANPPGIAWICGHGADVLVRYNRGSLPLYDVHGELIDVLAKLSRLRKPGAMREWAAWVHPEEGNTIRGRLCAVRLPPDKAREARERVRKEQGDKATAASLSAADFVIVFTTVPSDRLSLDRVLELYRLRWQIELHIKRDKSIAGLDKLPNFREDTIFTWICTKLLLAQIARKIASADVVPSSLDVSSANKPRPKPKQNRSVLRRNPLLTMHRDHRAALSESASSRNHGA